MVKISGTEFSEASVADGRAKAKAGLSKQPPSQGRCAWDGDDFDSGADGAEFVPLSKLEAQALRLRKPQLSIAAVLQWQLAAAVLLVCVVYFLSGADAACSVLYGAVAVWLPALFFGRGVQGRFASRSPASATVAFFMWELWKLVFSVGLLALAASAARLGGWSLSWPLVLLGALWTMKAVWVAVYVHGKRSVQRATR